MCMIVSKASPTCRSTCCVCLGTRSATLTKFLPYKVAQCRFDENVKAIIGVLTLITGILTAIAQFNDTLKKAVDSLGPLAELPIIVWLLVAATLLIAGVFMLRKELARRSRLLRPEALLLKADNPAHLKGRSEDIERLASLCYEYQQV